MRKIVLVSGAAVVVLGLAYAVSPLFFVQALRTAFLSGDTAKLERLVDFPALRQSFKDQFAAILNQRLTENPELKKSPLGTLGTLFGPALFDRLIDTYCTAETIGSAMKKSANLQQSNNGLKDLVPDPSKLDWSKLSSYSIIGLDRVKISSSEASLYIRFTGTGWKLYQVDLPRELVERISSINR
jgi:Protein of unknown function (DUF2939)